MEKTVKFVRKPVMELHWKIFQSSQELLAFIYFYGLSFHDTFVRIFYDLRTRNTGGKRLKRISSSICHFPTGQTQEVFSSLE